MMITLTSYQSRLRILLIPVQRAAIRFSHHVLPARALMNLKTRHPCLHAVNAIKFDTYYI